MVQQKQKGNNQPSQQYTIADNKLDSGRCGWIIVNGLEVTEGCM